MAKSNVPAGALLVALASTMSLFAHAGEMHAQNKKEQGATAASQQKMIRSAMTAAPKKVAEKATIVAMGADGKMMTLREGSNGFTCMPDNPATPGPDPMCMDQAAVDWAMAWIGKTQPTVGKVGFMYMLAGGTDASNTDPYATKPADGNHWIKTGPHVMIVGAEPSFYQLYPRSETPDTGVPYIMWPGTPYEHLMVPVK